MFENLQFDFLIFTLGFFITELLARSFPKLKLLIINGKKKLKIHHAYLGALVAFFASLTGQVAILNISLGAMVNDLVCHIKKRIVRFFKKFK